MHGENKRQREIREGEERLKVGDINQSWMMGSDFLGSGSFNVKFSNVRSEPKLVD